MPLDFETLREANVRRCRAAWPHEADAYRAQDWLVCVFSELGEVAHLVREVRAFDPAFHSMEAGGECHEHAGDEIADTVLYLDLLAYSCGISLGDAVVRKFNKTSETVKVDVKLDPTADAGPALLERERRRCDRLLLACRKAEAFNSGSRGRVMTHPPDCPCGLCAIIAELRAAIAEATTDIASPTVG